VGITEGIELMVGVIDGFGVQTLQMDIFPSQQQLLLLHVFSSLRPPQSSGLLALKLTGERVGVAEGLSTGKRVGVAEGLSSLKRGGTHPNLRVQLH